MTKDGLGDMFKEYEDNTRIPPGYPVIARLDGKNFHALTRNMDRPYDAIFTNRMIEATRQLAESTNAVCAYTQSDEISLTWFPKGDTEVIYGGKVQKIASLLAAECTVIFNNTHCGHAYYDDCSCPRSALFDCRVFTLPHDDLAAQYFEWRMQDAYKNSVAMLAQAHFSPKQLHGKHLDEQLSMLKSIDILHTDYKPENRYGTFIKKEKVFRKYTDLEINRLPPLHAARKNPNLEVERHEYKQYNLSNSENLPTENISFGRWLYDVSV